ncbi:MAG TPA: hypothetical protein VFD82_16240 [Planctomycetota bacterium]|nr:hypothetical protein [Planctomycetota bacterium]
MKTRHLVCSALCLVWLSACGDSAPKLPPLRADHQEVIRMQNDGLINQKYRIAGPSAFRFAAPVQDRVALWHWEPQVDGRKHSFGYHHGWRVDYWFKPDYEGYPEQPESSRMAFFADGELRGIFSESNQTTPLDLGKWDRIWTDPLWGQARAPGAAPR